MPVRLSSPGLLWRGRQESLLKKGGLPPPPPPSPENVSSGRAGRPCRCRAGRESTPQAEMRQAQGKGRLKTAARRQCRRTRLLVSLPCAFPTLPCGRYAPVRTVLFLPQHAKSSLKRELFSCAAASGRSARNKSKGWMAGIFTVARRPPSVRYRDRVVVAHPPITRAGDGMEGRGAMALLPRRQRPHGRRSHSRRDEGSCGQRQPG